MTEKEAKKEVNKVLKDQSEKGVLRWQIAVSLFSKGFSEKQVGMVMGGISHKTAHSYKIDFLNNKTRREIRNYLKLDVIRMQGFLKNVKALVGEPHKRVK